MFIYVFDTFPVKIFRAKKNNLNIRHYAFK